MPSKTSKLMSWAVPPQKAPAPTPSPPTVLDLEFDNKLDDSVKPSNEMIFGPLDLDDAASHHLHHQYNHNPNPSPSGYHTRDSSSDIDSDVFPSPHYFPSSLSADLSPPLTHAHAQADPDNLHLNFSSSIGFYSPPEPVYLDSFDYEYNTSAIGIGSGDDAYLPSASSWPASMHDHLGAVKSSLSSGPALGVDIPPTMPIPVPGAGASTTSPINIPFSTGFSGGGGLMLPPLPFPSFDAYPQTASFSPSEFLAPAPLPSVDGSEDYVMDDAGAEEHKPQWAADLWGAPASPTSPTDISSSDSTLTIRPTRHSFLAHSTSSPTNNNSIPYPFTNPYDGYGPDAGMGTGTINAGRSRRRAVSHRGASTLAQLFQSSSAPGPGLVTAPSMARRMSSTSSTTSSGGAFLISGSGSPTRGYATRKTGEEKGPEEDLERTIRERRTSRRSPPVRGASPEEGGDKASSPTSKSHLRPPKLAPSAWQLYFTDWIQKHQATSTRKLNVAQAAKEAGQEYATLTTEEKEPYKRKSQHMKEQRERELSVYMRSLTPDDIKRENVFRTEQRKLGRSRKSNIKDPNAPKKPLSAYFMFLQWIRASPDRVIDVFGGETETTKQSVLAAARWRAMTDDERKPFLAQAEQEKMEYEAARRVYEEGNAGGVSMGSGTNIHFSIMSQSPHSPGWGNTGLPGVPGTGAFSSTSGFTSGGMFNAPTKVEPESDNELSSSAEEGSMSARRR